MGDNALVVNIPPKRFGRLGRADVRLASKGTSMSASIHPPVQLHIVLDEDSYQGGDSVAQAQQRFSTRRHLWITSESNVDKSMGYTQAHSRAKLIHNSL